MPDSSWKRPWTSRAVLLPVDDVDTDQIVPARFLKATERTGFGRHLFADWRAGDRPDRSFDSDAAAGAGVLVAGANFGCGSSREHAAWALRDFGFRAIVAPSFSDIFHANALENGLLPVAIDGAAWQRLVERVGGGSLLTVDLADQVVRWDGDTARFPLDPFARHCFLEGIDQLGYLLSQDSAIGEFERAASSSVEEGKQPPVIVAEAGPAAARSFSILLLPGDGIGPEVTEQAARVLETVAAEFGHGFTFVSGLIGGAAIDATGLPLPLETLEACASADAVLLGAVGGPRWEGGPVRPEQGLLGLRQRLGTYANLRPLKVADSLADASCLREDLVRGTDLVFVRELTGGIYFGPKRRRRLPGGGVEALDTCRYSTAEIERVARKAGELARSRRGAVTSVDKANVLETSRLWRETVTRLFQSEFPDLELDHLLVDAAAMHLLRSPRRFDVVLTENLFGDVLTDEMAAVAGSIGVLPSASLGAAGTPGLFEPIHGSAPDLAGRGRANPYGAILSAALLLRYGLGLTAEADLVERAVESLWAEGWRTADMSGIGPAFRTEDVGAELCRRISAGSGALVRT